MEHEATDTVLCKSIKSELRRISLIVLANFHEISAIFRANLRTVLAIIQRKFGEISQGHSKIRKAKRNIEEANFLTPENSKRFR